MHLIQSILEKKTKRLPTTKDIRDNIGRTDLKPCPNCGVGIISITSAGDFICEGCDPDHNRRVVLRLFLLTEAPGRLVAVDWDELEERERGAKERSRRDAEGKWWPRSWD